MKEGSRRAIIAAFLANLGIAAAKLTAFLFTGAASMLAESIHSLADTGNQGLLLLGGARARHAPTAEHPFGYGRERYFWGFVVALVLFSLGSLFAIYEGIEKVIHPKPIESPVWALAVLGIAILLEGFSFRTALKEAHAARGSERVSLWQFVHRAKSPELPVVLLEDTAALIGLVLALLGIGLAMLLHEPRLDAVGSIGIGVLLGLTAAVLAVEMKSLLIGEAAGTKDLAALRAAIESAPRVRRLIHLRTLHLGPEELLVGAKLEFDAELSFAELARVIDDTEARVRAAVPIARIIYFEPDVYRGDAPP
ncbi:MAG TPA: cation diffusion facilitator family transporter [Polyangia bacterium]|jgi:cation diffusion facilitator family transporter